MEKGQRIHTIVAVVSQNVDQTIVGWKDLMAMGIISSDWPPMPGQETEGKILAADDDKEEKELAPPRRSAQVQERKDREAVNAILPTPTPTETREDEEKKKRTLPEGREKEEEREGQQQQPPTCSSGEHRLCSLTTTKLLSGQVQAAAPMGLPKKVTGQFVFLQQPNNNLDSWMKLQENNIIITIPSLIAAGIATAVVTGGTTGTAVYLTAGDADVVTGDQIKTEGGLPVLTFLRVVMSKREDSAALKVYPASIYCIYTKNVRLSKREDSAALKVYPASIYCIYTKNVRFQPLIESTS
jgi:hypothetical protein